MIVRMPAVCTAVVLLHDGAASRARIWRAVCALLGVEAAQIERSALGKPRLPASMGGVWFNVSHAASASLVAISRSGEVGADIEDRLREDDVLSAGPLVLHPREAAYIGRLEPAARAQAFARCWVRKEAALKARGSGFAADARSVDTRIEDAQPAIALGDGPAFVIHDAPPALGITAAVACVDAECAWQLVPLASVGG
jgi:4'-phosphopantetheinyl transferase